MQAPTLAQTQDECTGSSMRAAVADKGKRPVTQGRVSALDRESVEVASTHVIQGKAFIYGV